MSIMGYIWQKKANHMTRKIAMVRGEVERDKVTQANEDLTYWLSKTPQERLAAVTFLVMQRLAPSQRMDRTAFSKRIRKP